MLEVMFSLKPCCPGGTIPCSSLWDCSPEGWPVCWESAAADLRALLLWLDLPPHRALATSSFAIVPTALAGTITAERRQPAWRSGLSMGLAAFGSALVFGGLAGWASGWMLLAMQTVMYIVLAFAVRPAARAGSAGC